MSIALDTSGSASSSSMAYTCGAGTTILIAFVGQSSNITDSACSYNGVAMTVGVQIVVSASRTVSLHYLFSPATGASHTLTATGTNVTTIGAASYTGTSTSAIGATNARADTTTVASSTLALVTTVDNSWIVYAGTEGFNGFRTLVGSTGSQRFSIAGNGDPLAALMGADTTTTTAGSYNTVVTTTGGTGHFAHVALEIREPAAASTFNAFNLATD